MVPVCLCEISSPVFSDSLTYHQEDCLLNECTGGGRELLLAERWGVGVGGGGGRVGYCWLKASWSISMPNPSCLQEGLMKACEAVRVDHTASGNEWLFSFSSSMLPWFAMSILYRDIRFTRSIIGL